MNYLEHDAAIASRHQVWTPLTASSIVAVHGLNPFGSDSNAMTTWTASNKKNWLSDSEFLPSKIQNARILLYGYNSNVSFASSNAGLNEQAKGLLMQLRLERKVNPYAYYLCISNQSLDRVVPIGR